VTNLCLENDGTGDALFVDSGISGIALDRLFVKTTGPRRATRASSVAESR
jgi:hypothetical protein